MNRYLNTSDYGVIIQPVQLRQTLQVQPNSVIGDNPKLLKAENTAIEETISYLKQRWDVNAEFTPTTPWSITTQYTAGNRIILDYGDYSTQIGYSVGTNIIYAGNAYLNIGTISATTSTPNNLPSNWTELGYQYEIFYGTYPYPTYNSNNYYHTGDNVYWEGHTYTAVTPTTILTTTEALQYQRVEWLPPKNITPNSTANSTYAYWQDLGTYSIPIGTRPTNTSYWTAGDNRSQQIVMIIMDMALYYLHKSIAPMNIPELRKEAYRQSIKLLRQANTGDTTLNMPELQPQQGLKIRFTGDIRRNNNY